jgi:hypothetical protein
MSLALGLVSTRNDVLSTDEILSGKSGNPLEILARIDTIPHD